MSKGVCMVLAEVTHMQSSKLTARSHCIRLFTAAAVTPAVNGFLKAEEASLISFRITHDGTVPVVMLVSAPRQLSQSEAQTQDWP